MARRNALTPGSIEALREGKIFDPLTPGLSIEIMKGRPVWRLRRRIAGTDVTFKRNLGTFPACSIANARALAAAFNEQLDAGIDPRAVERDVDARNTLTVAKAHELYMVAVDEGRASRAKRRNKPSTVADKLELYRHEILPALGKKLVFDVTEADLAKLVLATGKRAKVRANRLATELKVFFGWASSLRGTEIGLTMNPAARLSDLKFPEAPRKRTLTLEEIGWFLRALIGEPRLYQRGMLLWLLTAARLSEVIHARTCEVQNGVWTIPEDRVKNSRPHRISLGPWGQSLMRANSDWAFPSDRIDGPRAACGWYKARNRVLLSMSRLAGNAARAIEDFGRIGVIVMLRLDLSETVSMRATVIARDGKRYGLAFQHKISCAELLRQLVAEARSSRARPLRLTTPSMQARFQSLEGIRQLQLEDISQRGMKVRHDGSFEPGLPLWIQLPNGRECRGVVRWTRECFAGLQLLDVLSADELGAVTRLWSVPIRRTESSTSRIVVPKSACGEPATDT